MEELIGKISIYRFLLVVMISTGGYLVFHLLYRFLMNQIKASGRSQHRVKLLSIIRKLVIIVLFVIVLVAFIFINPVINLLVLLFVTILGFDTFRNIFLGIILQQEFNLSDGKTYAIGNYEGILQHRSWTGLKLSSKGNLVFIPYKIPYQEGIKVKQKTSSYMVHLRCTLKENQKLKYSIEHIKSLLFPLPYLIEGNTPMVNAEGRYIHMEIGLAHPKYVAGLIELLNSNNYQTQIIDKN